MGFKKVKKDAYERLKRDICRIVLEYLKRCREKGESLTEKKLPYVKIQIEEFGETEIELF